MKVSIVVDDQVVLTFQPDAWHMGTQDQTVLPKVGDVGTVKVAEPGWYFVEFNGMRWLLFPEHIRKAEKEDLR